MKSLRMVLVAVVAVAAAACGGKNKGGAAPGGAADGDDAATPFNDSAVKAALASTPGVSECGVDPSSTMGVYFEEQRDILKGADDGGDMVEESFTCRAQGDGTWECQWAVFSKPAEADPEDPCAGGGTGFIIIATVSDAGAIAADKIFCNAPG